MTQDVVVRLMTAGDLPEATRIYRLAFGTFLGHRIRAGSA
jgi:hypothetical protein